jgi:hypothetical protein
MVIGDVEVWERKKGEVMPRMTIKVAVTLPRAVAREEAWREEVRSQLEEGIPETVWYITEDGEEHEISVEIVE